MAKRRGRRRKGIIWEYNLDGCSYKEVIKGFWKRYWRRWTRRLRTSKGTDVSYE